MLNKFSTKVLLFLLVAVMITALVACGGEKKPPVDDDEPAVTTKAPTTNPPEDDEPVVTTTQKVENTTVPAPDVTEPAPVTTKKPVPVYTGKPVKPFYPIVGDVTEAPKPDVTEPAVTTTAAPAVTTTAAPVVTTTAPITTTRPNGPVDDVNVSETPVADPYKNSPYTQAEYHDLFVQEGLEFFVDFSTVNSSTPAIVGGDKYQTATATAAERFGGAKSNYNAFIIEGAKDSISGGTAKILTPWLFEDWYKDGYWTTAVNGSGKGSDFRAEQPTDGRTAVENNYGGNKAWVVKTEMNAEDYYLSNGVWAVRNYASSWGNGYFNVGKGSALYYNNSASDLYSSDMYTNIKAAKEFTVEYSARLTHPKSNSYVRVFMGAKFMLYRSSNSLWLRPETGSFVVNDTEFTTTMAGADYINTLSFTYVMPKDGGTDVAANVLINGKSSLKGDFTYGSFNGQFGTASYNEADLDIFAIRVYSQALSEDEVRQNHFADIALILKLDITDFLELDAAGKLEVYKAFEGVTVEEGRETLQALLDSVAK